MSAILNHKTKIICGYRAGVEIQVCWYQGGYYVRTPQALAKTGRNWRPLFSTRGYLRQAASDFMCDELFR